MLFFQTDFTPMLKSLHHLLILTLFGVLMVSCSTAEQVAEKPQQQVSAENEAINPERPIPYPLDIPDVWDRAVERGTRTETGEPGENYWQNESSYSLTAEIDPENHILYGSGDISFTNNSPSSQQVVVLELAQNLHKEGTPKMEVTEITGGMNLTSIIVEGKEFNEITFRQRWTQNASGYLVNGTSLYIFPEESVASGETLNLSIDWNFEIPERGASGRMGRSRGNLYYIAYWYPHVSVLDDVYDWFNDSFVGNAEFYYGFADYDISITLPEGWLVMSTGEFLNPEETLSPLTFEQYRTAVSSNEPVTVAGFDDLGKATLESENGKLTWKFRAEQVRDVAFSATLESQWDAARTPVGDLDGDGEVDYSHIHSFYRETAPLWQSQVEYGQHSVTFFSNYTGIPYPWPHMTSVEGAEIIGGGMEFPMMTVIGDYNGAGAVRLYGVTAHEIAHMWIPMILSTNERRYTWIDEGFTTFHTNEANIDYYGSERFDRTDSFSGYLQIAGTDAEGEMMRWSDYHYPGPAYGVASYSKPASVLYALRTILGEETFREAYDTLMDRWAYKHPYPWDIFNTFEDVSGRDLSWFWRSWYYETWALDQSIADVYEQDGETVIEIEDIGNVPMPVLLEIVLEDGTVIERRLEEDIWLSGERTHKLILTTGSTIESAVIDPEFLFPDVDRRNNDWER